MIFQNTISQSNNNNPLSVHFELIATSYCNDLNHNNSDIEAYSSMYGQIRLSNQTDSIVSFWIMNCSWTDLFVIDPDSILLLVSECDNNYSKKITLAKGHSLIFNSKIDIPTKYFKESLQKTYQSLKNLEPKPSYNTFRIGFIFISEYEFYPLEQTLRDIAKNKTNDSNTIWSDPINIEYSVYRWKTE